MPVRIGLTIPLDVAIIYTIGERRKLEAANTKMDATVNAALAELDAGYERYTAEHRRDLAALQAMDCNEANLHVIILGQQQDIEALKADTTQRIEALSDEINKLKARATSSKLGVERLWVSSLYKHMSSINIDIASQFRNIELLYHQNRVFPNSVNSLCAKCRCQASLYLPRSVFMVS